MQRLLVLFISLNLLSASAWAAPVEYVFDTVTSIGMGRTDNQVVGIERNTGNSLAVSYIDSTNGEHRYAVSRCVPLLLTMIEKPGRYYLHLTIDSAIATVQIVECRLTLKS